MRHEINNSPLSLSFLKRRNTREKNPKGLRIIGPFSAFRYAEHFKLYNRDNLVSELRQLRLGFVRKKRRKKNPTQKLHSVSILK